MRSSMEWALPASTASSIFMPQLRIKPLKSLKQLGHYRCLFSQAGNHLYPLKCSVDVPNEKPFIELNNVKRRVDNFSRRLWETFPEPIKEFPWKKAEEVGLQRLLFIGKNALKWTLLTLYIASSLSDVIFAISRNQELLVPVGLFLGCVLADFLKETLQELFPAAKEEGLSRHLAGIGLFFVVVKIISLYLTIGGRIFLSHAGNGGLMQILWLRKKLQEEAMDDENEEQTPTSALDASLTES